MRNHIEKVLASDEFRGMIWSTQIRAKNDGKKFKLNTNEGDRIMHFIVVNEDVAYIRKDISQMSAGSEPTEEFTQEYYNRVQPFVNRICFGYLDETDPECIENCDFQHKCAEKRNEILLSIAKNREEEEYNMDFDARMAQTAQEIDDMKSNDLGSF